MNDDNVLAGGMLLAMLVIVFLLGMQLGYRNAVLEFNECFTTDFNNFEEMNCERFFTNE